MNQGCGGADGNARDSATCTFYQQVAAAGEQGDDWDPRTCENDDEEDYTGLITWGESGDNTWNDLYDCTAEEDAANTITTCLITLAISFFLNM